MMLKHFLTKHHIKQTRQHYHVVFEIIYIEKQPIPSAFNIKQIVLL